MSAIILSSEERSYYRNLLESKYEDLKTVNIEWFPKKGQLENLEKEIQQIEDTLQYDDYERQRMLDEEEEDEDMDI